MDILLLNWKDIKNPEVGGAEVIAFEFARRLAKDGHNVTFFSRMFSNARVEENIDGVRVVRRGDKFSVYFHAYLYYKSLKKKPEKVIDMVNTVCWQTPLYVPQKNRLLYVNQLAKEVWFYEKKFPISLIGYFLEKFEYISYKKTETICYSDSTKKDLVSFGMPIKNISLFTMGLDHDRYKTGTIKDPQPLFLFVARLVRMKRADLCIKAMKLFLKNHAGRLLIVGSGPDEARLFALIKKYKLQDQVIIINKNNFFFKKDSRDPKVKLMQESWALLLPSVKEGWGMVVTEAAACGTPAIVSDVTGLRDSVINNKSGIILSKTPTAKELSGAMSKIADNKTLREKLSKGALEWGKNFTWDKSYQEFKNIVLGK